MASQRMQQRWSLMIRSALGAVAFAATAAQANLIQNGDFETGFYAPLWTAAPGDPNDFVCKAGDPAGATTCIVHGGQYAMTFGKATTPDSFAQTVPTDPGKTYTLSFWFANVNATGGNESFAVVWDGQTVYSLAGPQPTFGYASVVVRGLKATQTVTTLQFLAMNEPAQWFLDDVIVEPESTAVPTLAGWTLLLVALALLATGWRRMRRASS